MSIKRIRFWCWAKFRLLRHAFVDTIAAPFVWNTARIAAKRAHQLALARVSGEAQVEIAKILGKELVTLIEKVTEPQKETTRILQTWLEGFKVTSPPTTTAMGEKDEYDLEMQQAMEKAGVDAANPAAVMRWLERESLMTTVD